LGPTASRKFCSPDLKNIFTRILLARKQGLIHFPATILKKIIPEVFEGIKVLFFKKKVKSTYFL